MFLRNPVLLSASLVAASSLSAAPLKPDERVIFFPTVGLVHATNLELDLHGWVCELEPSRVIVPVACRWLSLREESLTSEERQLLSTRMQWFLADSERGKTIQVRLDGSLCRAGRSAANGHFHNRVRIPRRSEPASDASSQMRQPERALHFTAALEAPDTRQFTGQAHLLNSTGLSVVSDIDDTIKISEVQDRTSLLRNTFLRPYQTVRGMPALYQTWAARHDAQFHYVSASPWQLYGPLADFLQTAQLPEGSFHLKPIRFKDGTCLDLFAAPAKHKREILVPLLRRFPHRSFILVGDSGEQDPEIYGELARQFPRQVWRVYIRNVTGEKPDATRYRQAFRGVEDATWKIFQDASELPVDP